MRISRHPSITRYFERAYFPIHRRHRDPPRIANFLSYPSIKLESSLDGNDDVNRLPPTRSPSSFGLYERDILVRLQRTLTPRNKPELRDEIKQQSRTSNHALPFAFGTSGSDAYFVGRRGTYGRSSCQYLRDCGERGDRRETVPRVHLARRAGHTPVRQ